MNLDKTLLLTIPHVVKAYIDVFRSFSALASPTYSASWVDLVTRLCCFAFQETALELRMNTKAEVERRLSILAAKSESEKPINGGPSGTREAPEG